VAPYVGAPDQGTTSTRFLVIDRENTVVGFAQKEHAQMYPEPGWVEHDAAEIWTNCESVIVDALADAGITKDDLAAVGITNQRETTVVWDRETGEPLAPAIVWQDTRTDELCVRLGGSTGPGRYRGITGLPLATYFAGPKLVWLLENVPGLREKADAGDALFGTIDSWLLWNLTGRHETDVTNASRTVLMDLHDLAWSQQIVRAMAIPPQMLPKIVPSSGDFGLATGVLEGVPVTGVLGDQQAAVFGQVCFDPGQAKNTYGTGCFMLLHTGDRAVPSKNGLLTTVAYQLGDEPAQYALEGSVAIAGAAVQWLRDSLKLIDAAPEVEPLAASVTDNGGVYFVPAFSGLFAPYWRSDARGVIAGLTRYANAGHIARATLEATAFQTSDVLEAMKADSGVELTELKVDGGMVVNELLMQFQADVLGVDVVRPAVAETTALGAAYAAGLAVGFWSDLDELRSLWKEDRRWSPTTDAKQRKDLHGGWWKAVDRTLGWVE
jgi:glycerol kinase